MKRSTIIIPTKYKEAIAKSPERQSKEDDGQEAQDKLQEILSKVGRRFRTNKADMGVEELIYLIWEIVRAVTNKEVNQAFIHDSLLSP